MKLARASRKTKSNLADAEDASFKIASALPLESSTEKVNRFLKQAVPLEESEDSIDGTKIFILGM